MNTENLIPQSNDYPVGHILHGANLFSSKSRNQIIDEALDKLDQLLKSKKVVNAFEKVNDILDKPATIQSIKPMKTRTLTLAVLGGITQFYAEKKNFSAHDISLAIRKFVADGKITISDVAQDFQDPDSGLYVSRVEHEKVRQIVRDVFEDGLIPEYVPKTAYSRGNSYVEYCFPGNPVTNSSAVASVTSVATIPAPAVVAITPPDSELLKKAILLYVDKKLKNGEKPSLKRIQSRLKRSPATCDQIREILRLSGYGFATVDLLAPSKDQVFKY